MLLSAVSQLLLSQRFNRWLLQRRRRAPVYKCQALSWSFITQTSDCEKKTSKVRNKFIFLQLNCKLVKCVSILWCAYLLSLPTQQLILFKSLLRADCFVLLPMIKSMPPHWRRQTWKIYLLSALLDCASMLAGTAASDLRSPFNVSALTLVAVFSINRFNLRIL